MQSISSPKRVCIFITFAHESRSKVRDGACGCVRSIKHVTLVIHHGYDDDDVHTKLHAAWTAEVLPDALLKIIETQKALIDTVLESIRQFVTMPRSRL